MAEESQVDQGNVVCRYFLLSTCRDADRCMFSHDRTRYIPDSICRYYLQGKCIFGNNCRFDHVTVNKKNNSRLRVNFDKTVPSSTPKDWINAPEFVPKVFKSYADTVKSNSVDMGPVSPTELCQYFMIGECLLDQCPYYHGETCELCQKACLHPYDEKQRKAHTEECEKEFERDMEYSFAIQNSMNKTCGICMDVILQKEQISERRFGILQKCNHVYCLSCIRKWRSSKHTEYNQDTQSVLDSFVTRACPECRIASDFVIPNSYFVDNEEEKQKLIADYIKALNQKDCKYFKKGEGTCPFGGACFYLHAKPDGTKVKLPIPSRRRRLNPDGELENIEQILLLHFIEHRENDIFTNVDLAELFERWSDLVADDS